MSTKRIPRRQAGLTMIELIVFVVVIGIAVSEILGAMASISARSADPLQRKQAMLRAESLLEEVALAKFTYCHPSDANAETATSTSGCATIALRENFGQQQSGESRPYFNINDYVTASGVGKSFHPTDASGNTTLDAAGAVMLPAGYNAMVSITPVTGFGPTGMQIGAASPVTAADAEVLRIRVTIGYGDGQQLVLDRYRTRYAPNSMP